MTLRAYPADFLPEDPQPLQRTAGPGVGVYEFHAHLCISGKCRQRIQNAVVIPTEVEENLFVQAALFLGLIFPPPAAFALVLAWKNRPGAGFAADGDEAAIMQGIVGNVILANIVPDLLGTPVSQRIELDQLSAVRSKYGVRLDDGHLGARSRASGPSAGR